MPMHDKGLTKLMEECGELVQVAAKKAAFIDAETHPDGFNLNARLEEEIADVLAASSFVTAKFGLDHDRIVDRAMMKLGRYSEWDEDGADNGDLR